MVLLVPTADPSPHGPSGTAFAFLPLPLCISTAHVRQLLLYLTVPAPDSPMALLVPTADPSPHGPSGANS